MSEVKATQRPKKTKAPPKPTFPNPPLLKWLGIANLILLIVNWIFPVYYLERIADKIPIIYNWNGSVLLSGSKFLILLLSFTAALVYSITGYFDAQIDLEWSMMRIPPGDKREKKLITAKTVKRIPGIIAQSVTLAGTLLLIFGYKAPVEVRASWIQGGIITAALVGVSGFFAVRRFFVKQN